MPDAHQPSGVVVRERLEQDRVDDAEDRRRGPDPERERETGGRAEGGLTSDPAEPEPDVLTEVVHHVAQPSRWVRLSARPGRGEQRPLRVPLGVEPPTRFGVGLLGRQAPLLELRRSEGDVRLDLLVELAREVFVRPGAEPKQPGDPRSDAGHRSGPRLGGEEQTVHELAVPHDAPGLGRQVLVTL